MFSKADIEKYFLTEKNSSLLLLVAGILALLLAAGFLIWGKTAVLKGAALPLLAAGLLQVAAGYLGYTQADGLRIENVYAFDMNPGALKTRELPRMQKMQSRCAIWKWASLFLTACGAVMLFMNQGSGNRFLFGVGLTVVIECLLLSGFGFIAEKRSGLYLDQLNNMHTGRAVG